MALFGKDSPTSKPQTQEPANNASQNDPSRRAPHLLGLPPSELAPASRRSPNGSANGAHGGDARAMPTESRLTVGPNIKLRGVEIEDCDTLVVEGYVEASMDSRVIEISERGVYKGKVEIDTAIVHGRFEGELTARERLIVHTTGDVSGKIRYGRLAIEDGGRVHGDLDEISNTKSSSSSSSKATIEKVEKREPAEAAG